VFTTDERARLRDGLLSAARGDPRISGAAITGSGAAGREDQWSDIDLALCLSAGADPGQVVADWTARMYCDHAAVHHLDVYRGPTLYRVFLLASTLQVDIAFWPDAEFGAISPAFRLVFGTARQRPASPPPAAAELIGTAWLHALHARSSIARGRVWQSEYMISGMRDHVLALACLRHGVSPHQGRGMDSLPPQVAAALTGTLVRSLGIAELRRAFAVTSEALLDEVERVDADLAGRLAGPLRELAG
jgi:hypothetical protein